MFKSILAAVAVIMTIGSAASAGEFKVGVAKSTHVGLQQEYNEVHAHVRYEADNGVIAGVYHNSEDTLSAYAGYEYNIGAGFSVEGGLVTGYANTTVLPFAKVNYEINENVELFLAPALEFNGASQTIGAVFGIQFWF